MAIFGSNRDISMFRSVNKELINDVISTQVDFYKINLNVTKSNVYGEAPKNKTYYIPVRLACLIEKEDIINNTDDQGVDTDQRIVFHFLRDGILDELELVPSQGDIIHWDERYWEIDNVNINQYLLGKNNMTNKSIGSGFGANWSYNCSTFLTRRSKIQTEPVRFGQNGSK